MREAAASTSLAMWVEKRTIRSAACSRRICRKRVRDSTSRPVVGSSTIRIGGEPRSARAIPTLWRMPPEKSRTLRRACSVRPTAARQRSISSPPLPRGRPCPAPIAQWSRNCSAVSSG